MGHDDALQVEILTSRTVINSWPGRSHENLELHDKIIELTRRLYGERDLRVAHALEARSITYEMLGQSERSIEDRRAAIELVTALTGADNPCPREGLLQPGRFADDIATICRSEGGV